MTSVGSTSQRNLLLAVVGLLGSTIAAIPMPATALQVLWSISVLAMALLVAWRVWRLGVAADRTTLEVRNIGRTHRVPWSEVADLAVERSDNATNLVTCLVVRRTDGSQIVARGASSYRRQRVEWWREDLLSVRTGRI